MFAVGECQAFDTKTKRCMWRRYIACIDHIVKGILGQCNGCHRVEGAGQRTNGLAKGGLWHAPQGKAMGSNLVGKS